jgi:hypothetical protein
MKRGYVNEKINRLLMLILLVILSSCFHGADPEHDIFKIEEDFWLQSSVNQNNYSLIWENDLNGASTVLHATIKNVRSNDEFIIAKRIYRGKQQGEFEIYEPKDTCYLTVEDNIYFKDKIWYHSNNDWNYPDSLNNKNPDGNTYYLIDLRKYDGTYESLKRYSFDNEYDFYAKLKLFGALDKIDF